MTAQAPKNITGGCLCGGIRYNISFEAEGSWPPVVSTCQCSLCRKWTGCLYSTDVIVKRAQVSPVWSSFETFTEHESTPGTKRAFCSNCGSGIAWFNEHMPEELIIFVGTIDEEYLLGKKVNSSIKQSEHGEHFERKGGFVKELTDSSTAGNLYWQNTVPGISDNLPGPKFLQHFIDAVPLPESNE